MWSRTRCCSGHNSLVSFGVCALCRQTHAPLGCVFGDLKIENDQGSLRAAGTVGAREGGCLSGPVAQTASDYWQVCPSATVLARGSEQSVW